MAWRMRIPIEAKSATHDAERFQKKEKEYARYDKIRQVFRELDLDDDGKMDENALLEVGAVLGLTYERAEEKHADGKLKQLPWDRHATKLAMDVMDTDHDGYVTEREFCVYYQSLIEAKSADQFDKYMAKFHDAAAQVKDQILKGKARLAHRTGTLAAIFKAWDMDMSGHLDKEELRVVGFVMHNGNWTEAQNQELMKRCDTDGDGEVTLEEFLAFYKPVLYDADDATFERGLSVFRKVTEAAKIQDVAQKKLESEQAQDEAAKAAVAAAEEALASAADDEAKQQAQIQLDEAQRRLATDLAQTAKAEQQEQLAEKAEEMVHHAADGVDKMHHIIEIKDDAKRLQAAEENLAAAKATGNEVEVMMAETVLTEAKAMGHVVEEYEPIAK